MKSLASEEFLFLEIINQDQNQFFLWAMFAMFSVNIETAQRAEALPVGV